MGVEKIKAKLPKPEKGKNLKKQLLKVDKRLV